LDTIASKQVTNQNSERRANSAQPSDVNRSAFYLHPGQIFVSTESYAVTTILGSCVAACLWDPASQIGGINHFLLPVENGDGQAVGRFGNLAVRRLIAELLALGVAQNHLRAKLFGGACVLDAFRHRENHLGSQNVEIARAVLAAADVPIVSEDVGGRNGRKLIFCTDNGAAWVKAL
jgi:chemotaxis protein CheD